MSNITVQQRQGSEPSSASTFPGQHCELEIPRRVEVQKRYCRRSFLTLPCEARTNFLELWQHSTDSLAAAPAAFLLTEADEFLDALPGIDLGRV
jgi:hypothetical protein